MPFWTPPSNSYAMAFQQPSYPPGVKVETKGASAYEQERIGQRSETSQVIPINRGELEHTEKGDYVQQSVRVVTATESYDQTVITTDIGAGADNLVPVSAPTTAESYDVEQVSWAPTQSIEVVATPQLDAPNPLAQWWSDLSWYQPETAPSYDLSQPDSSFYQPETAPPPVSYTPLPVEQAPVSEVQYVQQPSDPYKEYSDYLTMLEQMENEAPYGWSGGTLG